jgi:putative membrane protein
MKISSIIRADLKDIYTNRSALMIVAILCILPACYAWFNVIASWDPYGNTKNIPVAIVSKDEGVTVFGIDTHIGKDLMEKIKSNTSLGWKLVSEPEATMGVIQWKYYASIIIPADFSKNMMSFLSDNQKKPQIFYTVNDKINAIVPKITQKWVESIQSQIESAFIGSVNENIFWKTNMLGVEITNYRDDFNQARTLLKDLDSKLPAIHKILIWVLKTTDGELSATNTIISKIPELSTTLGRIIAMGNTIQTLDADLTLFLETIPETVHYQMFLIQSLLANGIGALQTGNFLIREINDATLASLPRIQTQTERIHKILLRMKDLFIILNTISSRGIFTPIINTITTLDSKIVRAISLLQTIERSLSRGEKITDKAINELSLLSNSINTSYMNLQKLIQVDLHPWIQSLHKDILFLIGNIQKKAISLQSSLPKIQTLLQDVQWILKNGNRDINEILDHWTEITGGIHDIQNISNALTDDRINSLLRLFLLDPNSEKNFFEHPIQIVPTHLFPTPNYGSAISPFFNVLALWVGALLSVSLLSVRSRLAKNAIRNGYLGRLFLFILIGSMQAFIVGVGWIWLIGITIVHHFAFIVLCIGIAILFQIIIFSIVFLFGNAGKVIGIILLLLQLSASSGTFPVELTNSFFEKIHPYLPFTYAISALRESTGGIVTEILYRDMTVLSLMWLVIITVAWISAPYLSKLAIAFDHKTHGLDIFHE